MLRFLSLTTALSAALVPFLPEVAFGLPAVGNINVAQTVIPYPNSNPGTVIVNPNNSYPTGTYIDPNGIPNTVIVNPVNPYPTGTIGPTINNYGTVIVKPGPANPTVQQHDCSSVVFGSPIPRPVPVNPNTGIPCR